MKDLTPYSLAFDGAYPDYATGRYDQIVALTERLGAPDVLRELGTESFQHCIALIEPLIAIKNYKSQVPFPIHVISALRHAAQLKACQPPDIPLSGLPENIFLTVIEEQGFQLPTVSALFHFCHPKSFPIVDRNVEEACEILKDAYAEEFEDLTAPTLPVAATSSKNKVAKYKCFIAFIDRVRILQRQHHGVDADYRFIDKALMVLGVDRLRQSVDQG